MSESIILLLFLCLCALCLSAPQDIVTPPSTNDKVFRKDYKYDESTGSYYKYHKIQVKFQDAANTCKYEGAELAVPKNEAEAGVLAKLFPAENTLIWIGLHDIYAEGEFITLNGTSIDEVYQVWNSGEPNNVNDDEDCVIMGSGKTYNDVPCHYKYQYICRKPEKDVNYNWICETYDKDYFYNIEGDRCYKLHKTPKTWNEAFKICRHEEAKLAVVNSESEAKILTDFINTRYPVESLRENFDKLNIFLDFSDLVTPGTFHTSDGTLLSDVGYDNWAPGQPDNWEGKEHCGSMFRDGKLNDMNCNSKTMFFCEKVLGPPLAFTLLERAGYHGDKA